MTSFDKAKCGVQAVGRPGGPCGRPLTELRTEDGKPACLMHGYSDQKPREFWDQVRRLAGGPEPQFDSFVFPALPDGWFTLSTRQRANFSNAHFLGAIRFGELARGASFNSARFETYFNVAYFGPYVVSGRPRESWDDSAGRDKGSAEEVLLNEVSLDFSNVTFGGPVDLGGSAGFGKAIRFRSANFLGPVRFYGFEVWSDLDASGAVFHDLFDTMGNLTLTQEANFSNAVFQGPVNLGGVILWRSQALNLSGAHFVGEVSQLYRAGAMGVVNLERAVFDKPLISPGYRGKEWTSKTRIRCVGTKFRSSVDFSTQIFPECDFSRASFEGNASFADCEFPRGVSFEGATFSEGADLSRISVGADAKAPAEPAILDLRNSRFLEPSRVSLLQINERSGRPLRVRLLNTRPEGISLEGIRWWETEDRLYLQDEEDLGNSAAERPSHELVATCYRRLTSNFESGRAHDKAEQCIYRVFELRRTDPASPWHTKALLAAYRLLSGYGGSYARAAVWLLVAVVAFACAYAIIGLTPREPIADHTQVLQPAASRVTRIKDSLITALVHSAEIGTFRRNPTCRVAGRSGQFVELIELVVVPSQAALLLLALRRSFKA
jgi:uncharacterized protein YjbI with pentapeptide repeats